jgi:hypothetical protein
MFEGASVEFFRGRVTIQKNQVEKSEITKKPDKLKLVAIASIAGIRDVL